ncbi:MAG TPA: hypothetical protein DCM86_11265 [Verrucomicrobiales bacterium]|nr:hypothetical protein [Verrucomicrobiales bacterium]
MRSSGSWILAGLLLAGFLGLMGHLFNLRFSSGDVYPPYSTLRADPLGARVLFESLDQLPGLRTMRHFQSPRRWPPAPGTTLCLFGLPARELSGPEEEVRLLEQFAISGGRLLITLRGDTLRGAVSSGSMTNRPAPVIPRGLRAEEIPLAERWGFRLADHPLPQPASGTAPGVEVLSPQPGPRPQKLTWHSSGTFEQLSKQWESIYLRGTNAVVIERHLGAGTLVLATDSYFASNEALRDERPTAFLSWLLGPARTVVFDETHLGVSENPGFATLARRYRLQAFFVILGIVALLFIWRSSNSFVPPPPLPEASADWIQGRDAAGGLAGLLRRNVPPEDLLRICLEEWNRSGHGGRSLSKARLQRIQEIIDRENEKPPARRDLVAVYREIAAAASTEASPSTTTPITPQIP